MHSLSKAVRRAAILGVVTFTAVTVSVAPANAAPPEFYQGHYANSTKCNFAGATWVDHLYMVGGIWRVIQGWSCRGAGGRDLYLR